MTGMVVMKGEPRAFVEVTIMPGTWVVERMVEPRALIVVRRMWARALGAGAGTAVMVGLGVFASSCVGGGGDAASLSLAACLGGVSGLDSAFAGAGFWAAGLEPALSSLAA